MSWRAQRFAGKSAWDGGLTYGRSGIPRKQRQPVKLLQDWLALSASREQGLYRAHTEGGITMTRIATPSRAFGVSGQSIDCSFEQRDAKDKTCTR